MDQLTLWKNQQLNRLKIEMDRMVRDFYRDFGTPVFNEIHGDTVLVNFVEDTETLVISAELPGIDLENIEVAVSSDTLILGGRRKDLLESDGSSLKRSSSFSNHIKLPCRVDPGKVEAIYEQNKLQISLPKSLTPVFKKITVQRLKK